MLRSGLQPAVIADRLGPILDALFHLRAPLRLKLGFLKLFCRGLMPGDVAERLGGPLLSALARNTLPRAPEASLHTRAVNLRAMGWSYDAIANELGVNRHAAQRLLKIGTLEQARKRPGARR